MDKHWSKQVPIWAVPAFFIVWAAVEYVVSILSAIIWFGKNGSLDTVLPFASLAPFAAHTPLRYLARFVGFYGLSATVMVLLAVVLVKNLRRYALLTWGIVLMAVCCAWAVYRVPSGPVVKSVIVSETFDKKAKNLPGYYQLVVFPEYGIDQTGQRVDWKVTKSNGNFYFIGSERVDSDHGHKNVLIFGTERERIIEERPKSRLIPGGEYIPYFVDVVLHGLHANHTLLFFENLSAVEKGPPNYQPLKTNNGYSIGSAVCASIIASEDYRKFVNNGASLLTNSASLGIFESRLFTFQHEGLAMFMATANARPFLQSSNYAEAFALDHNGRMLARQSPVGAQEVLANTNTKITPYTKLGDWPAYIGLVILAFYFLKRARRLIIKRPK